MGFRFPHPFENVVDAIKAAADPGNPEDGGLAMQLLNENNHALEDQLGDLDDADDSDMDFISEQGYGTISGTGGSFSVPFSLPSEGLWLLTPKFDPHFGARIEVAAGDSGYIGIGVSAAIPAGNSWSESVVHPLAMPYRSSPTNVSLRTLAGSWRAPFVYDTNFLEGTAAERLAMSIDVTGGATGTWSSASGGGALINVRLYGVRLGPSLL